MKKLILILLFVLPIKIFAQKEKQLSSFEASIMSLTLNMFSDSSEIINIIPYYSKKQVIEEEYDVIAFVCNGYNIDTYFIDNQLIGCNIYYDKKDKFKEAFNFIDRNLFRLMDDKYKYRWIFFDKQNSIIIFTTINKKEKQITIKVK